MIQFITGLIVTTSIVIVLYLIGRIVAKHIYQEPNPDFEDILLAAILAILVMGMLACVCILVYWVGAAGLSLIG